MGIYQQPLKLGYHGNFLVIMVGTWLMMMVIIWLMMVNNNLVGGFNLPL